jgi:hypothetical protein
MFLFRQKQKLEKEIFTLEAKRDTVLTQIKLEEELKAVKSALRDVKFAHEEETAKIKHERKIADEDIKHMIKMKEERLGIEFEKRVVELEKTSAAEIAKVKDTYRDKMEMRLQEEVKQTKEMYSEILKRLPDISVKMKGKI